MTETHRKDMTDAEKAAFISKHGYDAYVQKLPVPKPQQFDRVQSLVDLVPLEIRDSFIRERGQNAWNSLAGRALRAW